MPELDIFLVNYYSASDTQKAIEYLGHHLNWQYHIIDNSQNSNEWDSIRKLEQAKIACWRAPENLGFGNACNFLYSNSKSPYVLLLNPDARIRADDVNLLIQSLESVSCRAATAPIMKWVENDNWFIPRATPQSLSQQLWNLVMSYSNTIWRWIWQQNYQKMVMDLNQTTWLSQRFLSGAVLLLKRSHINKLDPKNNYLFDPQFFMFFEDADLSQRLRKAHFEIGITRHARASHLYQHSSNKERLMQTSAQAYWHKHLPKYLSRLLLQQSWVYACQRVLKRYPKQPSLNSQKSLEQYLQKQQAQLIAWSPSAWLIPCIYREFSQKNNARGFSSEQWRNLSSGQYFGMSMNANGIKKLLTFMKPNDD